LLHLNRGRLLPGYDADLILVSPGEKWKVESSVFASKGKATPFEGSVLEGKVRMTIVHGEKVYGAGVL
jgi:dihydroorotase